MKADNCSTASIGLTRHWGRPTPGMEVVGTRLNPTQLKEHIRTQVPNTSVSRGVGNYCRMKVEVIASCFAQIIAE